MKTVVRRIVLNCLVLSFFLIGQSQPAQADVLPVLVGIYPMAELSTTVGDITALDTWLGTPTVSIAGIFLDLETPSGYILGELNASWDAGYIPFVNLGAGSYSEPRTAAQIANGDLDTAIRAWADVYKSWSNNGEKRALIAPLQEMNGYWTTYGLDPANFKLAYYRIFKIFQEQGVQRDWAGWVFAPNGWSQPGHEFENYYPGHSVVDAVGFSSFNFGSCPIGTGSDRWDTYDMIYRPYLDRMAVMAPGKPLFVAEIGTVAQGGDKNAWLYDTLTNLAAYPGLRAWVYFNRTETTATLDCQPYNDHRVYKEYEPAQIPGNEYPGFKNAVLQQPYGRWSSTAPEVNTIMFNPPEGRFEDAWPASAFSGLNSLWYADWVNRLANAGITGGCAATLIDLPALASDVTLQYYCPEDSVTRAQMAVFLERGIHGSSFTPPTVPLTFTDTGGSFAQYWIEALRVDGITGGCGTGTYCPDASTTRAEMAVFLLRSKHGASYIPPVASGTMFDDVPAGYWAANWIEQLASEGITSGCAAGRYCPEDTVTRAQMAVFLVRTFGLP